MQTQKVAEILVIGGGSCVVDTTVNKTVRDALNNATELFKAYASRAGQKEIAEALAKDYQISADFENVGLDAEIKEGSLIMLASAIQGNTWPLSTK